MRPERRASTPSRSGVPNLSSWTISAIRRALDDHERGSFAQSAVLADALGRNPRIESAITTRTHGALGLPFTLEAAEKNPRRAESTKNEFELPWGKFAPEPLLNDLLRWAVLMGIAFAEVWWETSARGWTPRMRVVHPYWISWRDYEGRFVCRTERGIVPVTPGDGWLVFGYGSERSWMRGVVRCLGLESELRSLAVRDWARWSETHGLPIKKAKVPAQASDKEKDRYFNDIADMGSSGTVLLPQGNEREASFDLELLEAKGTESDGFSDLISLVSTDISIAILGQNLTTEVQGGSRAAAIVHDRVRQDYLEADTETLATALHEQVLQSWALYNRGDAQLAPMPHWDAQLPEDKDKLATTLKTTGESLAAWNAALAPQGASIDVLALAEKLGVPVRKQPQPPPAPLPTTTTPALDPANSQPAQD
jgi:phage gp29-like protein